MAVQINQLIIRMVVTEDSDRSASSRSGSSERGAGVGNNTKLSQQKLVAECVEQVMEVLREQKER